MSQLSELTELLAPFGQQHVVKFWDELSPSQQDNLAAQIRAIDLNSLQELATAHAIDEHGQWAELARRAEPPPGITLPPTGLDPADASAARQLGGELFAAGDVGFLVVAGGQGSRLGFAHPKGMFPVGPVSDASLFQIHIEKVVAVARRYGCRIPLYLMTSPATDAETRQFLEQHDRFGLPPEDLFIFCQGTMPAVDAKSGKLLLSARDELFLSPDGHGGTVAAFLKSGALADAQSRGIKQLFYFQVDNPLSPLADPLLIGYHRQANSELTSVAVRKTQPDAKVGNFISVDGHLQVIEYSDFPAEVAEQRLEDGSLKFWAGSIAIHVIDVGLLQRVGPSAALPYHRAHKKVPFIGSDGQLVEPDGPNAFKFEKFIFDLLPFAAQAIVVERPRHEVFAPLKNAPGYHEHTPQHVRQALAATAARWLEGVGAAVGDRATVEISPLFALDKQQLKNRLGELPALDSDVYLRTN